MTYFDELCTAMKMVAGHPDTIFIGQGVAVAGTTMSQTFENINPDKRIEMPVAEDMQMGMAIGMSLGGYIPICIFPRWNFVLRAADQLVNHLDRLPLFSGYRPKVIIRVAVPSNTPFDPGPQHDDDFTGAFTEILRTIKVYRLMRATQIVPTYQDVLVSEDSSIIVEHTEFYKDARAKAVA